MAFQDEINIIIESNGNVIDVFALMCKFVKELLALISMSFTEFCSLCVDDVGPDVEDALRFYTKLCSLNVTAESLANFANRLANDGVGNISGKRYLSSETVRIVKTLMLTCGMYDGSGTYA